jgi:hypothetical protein
MDEQELGETGLQPEESEMIAKLQEEIRRMSVADHLSTMIQSLAALATRRIGITQETREERDLEQAQLAIDALRALMPVLSRARDEREMAAYRNMISELQMAYVAATAQD